MASGQGHYERAFAQLARLHDPSDSAYHPVHGLWSLASLAEAAASHQGPIDELLGRLLVDLAPAGSDDDIAILGVQWQG